MVFKKLIFVVFGWLTVFAAVAQAENTADSLDQVLAGIQGNEEKFDLMMDLSQKSFSNNTNISLHYAEEAYKLAEKSGDKFKQLQASYRLAKIFYFLSDLTHAMEYATTLRDKKFNYLILRRTHHNNFARRDYGFLFFSCITLKAKYLFETSTLKV